MKAKITSLIKSIAGTLEYRLRPWNYASDELVVLCLHSTPKSMLQSFRGLLDFLQRHFKIISPHQLQSYFNGEMNSGPYLLFTFDDGLLNNRYVADLLHERGFGAYFFVVPDFILADNQEPYYRTCIRQKTESEFDQRFEDVHPLGVSELKRLISQGHAVGSHSMSHTMRSFDDNLKSVREVEQSKFELMSLLGSGSDAFCSIVNTNLSVGAQAKRMINSHYRYHFTTFPGLNGHDKNAQLIFRRNIELNWSMGMIKYALGRADLSRWLGEIERFRRL